LFHVVDVVGADSKLAVGDLVELSGGDDHKGGKVLVCFCEDSNRGPQIATRIFVNRIRSLSARAH
jgi:hypothetical protein